MDFDIWGKPPKKGKSNQLFNPGFGGFSSPNKPQNTTRGTLYSSDKDKILQRQRGKCAGKNCSRNHGKKLPVNIRSHFDHIKPLALLGKDIPSNIQALCANCHQEKTREDRKKIAETKKNGNASGNMKPPKRGGLFNFLIKSIPPVYQ